MNKEEKENKKFFKKIYKSVKKQDFKALYKFLTKENKSKLMEINPDNITIRDRKTKVETIINNNGIKTTNLKTGITIYSCKDGVRIEKEDRKEKLDKIIIKKIADFITKISQIVNKYIKVFTIIEIIICISSIIILIEGMIK